ncbi:MAG: HEAT repeat domain-containing protein [Pirellulales bacterium]
MLLIAQPQTPGASVEAPAETVAAGAGKTLVESPSRPTSLVYDGHGLEHWFDLLASPDPNERRKAAEVLSGVGPEAASELSTLISRSTAPHILVRHWATVCLGQIGTAAKEAIDALMSRLDDEQPLVREKAVQSIEQVLPEARPFLPRLQRELNAKDADRAHAIEVFRRDLKTAGVSRFRFWACTCGRVYIKLDLDERLRKMVAAPHEVDWEGMRACGHCGARYADRDVYAGKYDVPEPHWPKLRAKFGKQLSVPDDFFDDAKQDAGYRISDEAFPTDLAGMPSLGAFSLALDTIITTESEKGYAIAAAPAAMPIGAQGVAKEEVELVPGATVPKTGKYKCRTCSKKRLAKPGQPSEPSLVQASVVMPFKSGKTFSECPKCGDLTD